MKVYCKEILIMASSLLLNCHIFGLHSLAQEIPELELQYLAQAQVTGPCLASLVSPPSAQGHCMPYAADIDAAPTPELSRRIVFAGAGDNFLHIYELDSGKVLGRIPTLGRVITRVIFSRDKTVMYFGTDQGQIAAHDAFFPHKRLWVVQADSRIQNNLMIVGGEHGQGSSLLFSSSLLTIYRVDLKDGKEIWQLSRPLSGNRLKLASYSNMILLRSQANGEGFDRLAAPHADGYVSIVDLSSGVQTNAIRLGSGMRERSFPGIVAPMLYFNGLLWVASYDLGVFVVDPLSGQVRNRINLNEVQQLAVDGERIYAATTKELVAISMAGGILWKNNFGELRTRGDRFEAFFGDVSSNAKRVFNGLPSSLIKSGDGLIMATSLGSVAVFNTRNGELKQVTANSLGLGPKIFSLGSDGLLAVTPRGLLAKFKFKKLRKGGNQL